MLIENKNKDQEDNNRDTSSVATLEKPKVKKPPLYRVILLNDDYTPMEFVVYVLQIFFGFDGDKAQQIMLAVHTHGKGVCGIFTREVAETKSARALFVSATSLVKIPQTPFPCVWTANMICWALSPSKPKKICRT